MYQYDRKVQEMINYDEVTKEHIKEHNPNWWQFSIIHTAY